MSGLPEWIDGIPSVAGQKIPTIAERFDLGRRLEPLT
jgi:hypothetical protein